MGSRASAHSPAAVFEECRPSSAKRQIRHVVGTVSSACFASSPIASQSANCASPTATWVQEQSRIAAKAWVLPPEVRNAALRERGDQLLRDRYAPLIATP